MLTRNKGLERHSRVAQRESSRTDGGQRCGAVGGKGVGRDAGGVGKHVLTRQYARERALDKRRVTRLAADHAALQFGVAECLHGGKHTASSHACLRLGAAERPLLLLCARPRDVQYFVLLDAERGQHAN